jgi:Tol biopolymer transport system component
MRRLISTLMVVGIVAFSLPSYFADGKPVPATDEEVAKAVAAENANQKKLREEIRKVGGTVYFCCRGKIYSVGLDGSRAKVALKTDMGSLSYPLLSPDGTRLLTVEWRSKRDPETFVVKQYDKRYPTVIRDMNNTMLLVDLASGKITPLCYAGSPHWSSDGKLIIYNINLRNRGGRPSAVLDLAKLEEKVVTPVRRGGRRFHGFNCFTPDMRYFTTTGGPGFNKVPFDREKIAMREDEKVTSVMTGGPGGCNCEFSNDGKWFAWTIDTYREAGGWLCYSPVADKPGRAVRMNLGWDKKSVNYDPCFSPCDKYLVYMHGEPVPGKKSYDGVPSEIYAARFPPDGVHIRISWLNGNARHPHWVKFSAGGDGAR